MTLGEVLWAPQAECGFLHSNQDKQDSDELCEGVTEGGLWSRTWGSVRLLISRKVAF